MNQDNEIGKKIKRQNGKIDPVLYIEITEKLIKMKKID